MASFTPSTWKRCQLTPRDQRNQRRLLVWLFVWTLSWVAGVLAIKHGWASSPLSTVAVVALSTILGITMMLAYWKFIREADELQRKIQLEGLAVGFGVGIVGAYTIHLLARAGFTNGIDFGDVGALMIVTYAIAVIIGERRYA